MSPAVHMLIYFTQGSYLPVHICLVFALTIQNLQFLQVGYSSEYWDKSNNPPLKSIATYQGLLQCKM